jgi:hypothetical protein
MKIIFHSLMIGSMLISGSLLAAEPQTQTPTQTPAQSQMVSTGSATKHYSDDLATGDPYSGKTVSAAAEAGPAGTQAPYTEGCKESRCIRAEQRQKSNPYWKGHKQGSGTPAPGAELVQ